MGTWASTWEREWQRALFRPECDDQRRTTTSTPLSRTTNEVDASIIESLLPQITGFLESEVLGKNCRFLQGPGTDREAVRSARAALREVTRFATHDPLTDLPNRSGLFAGLNRHLADATRSGEQVAVLFIDLVRQVSKEVLGAFHDRYGVDGNEITIGVSVGIALFPDHGRTAPQLIRAADAAMYAAKNAGGGRSVMALPQVEPPG